MNNNQNLKAHALRTAVLRYYIADAFISLMVRVHNEPVYIEDGERIELSHEKVVSNIIYQPYSARTVISRIPSCLAVKCRTPEGI
ncbi:TPA: hypothetical protein N2N77_005162 [Escherichia coli]|nr:hypothetical protein [Escherichia coli]HCL5805502.1 hypothetical protein [Escherichia coli]